MGSEMCIRDREIYRESIDTSVRMSVDVLRKLGFRAYGLTRMAQNFIKHDEETIWKLASERHDKKNYISRVREQIALQEELLSADRQHNPTASDHAWDSEKMRAGIKEMAKQAQPDL